MISGPFVSTIFCVLFAALVFLTDSIHLFFPVVESRRYHASMLMKLFGPLMGIKHMDRFHAWLTTVMTVPIIAGIWHRNQAWSLLTVTLLATLQPYFLLVAYYMKSCDLRNPSIPLMYSAIFGILGLVWREIDYTSSFFNIYDIPMITIWHSFISFVVLFFICRIKSRVPLLNASIQVEKIKENSLRKGECTWPNANEMPVFNEGKEPYPILVETAISEQEQISVSESKTIISILFLCSALFMFGTSQSQNHREMIDDRVINICLYCITLPLVFIELTLIALIINLPEREETELFDNIEGARSFDHYA